MRSTLLTLSLVFSAGIYACQPAQTADQQSSTQTGAEDTLANSIVRDTITNSQGVKLIMGYDNANHDATFVLKGEAITLKQDTTASGLKYSNAEYEYTEHQGKLTLKKGGKVVFRNQ